MGNDAGLICVLGFGKIGQAFGAFILEAGYDVLAVDSNSTLAGLFARGAFESREPGVGDILGKAWSEGRLVLADHAPEGIAPLALIVTIPFGITSGKKPDDSRFIDGLLTVKKLLRDKLLLVVETSVPVGFCRDRLLPALEAEGMEHGRDYLLAHSPERIKSGTMLAQLDVVPKVVGGIDEAASVAAESLYRSIFKKGNMVRLPDIESAEMVKMAGMMYRDINIALANQLAVFAGKTGVDLVSLLPLINADSEAKLLQPGIGVGGHCTPVYPYFMIDAFRRSGLVFSLAEESRLQNESMGGYAAGIVKKFLETNGPDGARQVTVLGLAFRPGVKEDAYSPAYTLVSELESCGFSVIIHDPMYNVEELTARGLRGSDSPYVQGSSVAVLVTMHAEYMSLDMERLAGAGTRLLVDGRNAVDSGKVLAAGISYRGIGR